MAVIHSLSPGFEDQVSRVSGAAATAFVVVLVPYKILIHEDKHEKNQTRSHTYALCLFLFSAFRIPTSEFLSSYTMRSALQSRNQ